MPKNEKEEHTLATTYGDDFEDEDDADKPKEEVDSDGGDDLVQSSDFNGVTLDLTTSPIVRERQRTPPNRFTGRGNIIGQTGGRRRGSKSARRFNWSEQIFPFEQRQLRDRSPASWRAACSSRERAGGRAESEAKGSRSSRAIKGCKNGSPARAGS